MPEHKPRNQSSSPRETERFVVRLPVGMRGRIAEAASRSHRSMNSEIVSRLELSLEQNEQTETSRSPSAEAIPELRAVGRHDGKTLMEEETRLLRAYYQLQPAQRKSLLQFLEQLRRQ